ncbi:hypothetical protein DdX_16864 [Ditylenchus destructor]|uniref:Uncharacterized protein n=1 Tax=Ditylenchus destructor TaxID=166010 RepID=A0AAD4QZK3_9BILA|nr:hypothetical protein DdX_16864 [Ditylenchus destructor]
MEGEITAMPSLKHLPAHILEVQIQQGEQLLFNHRVTPAVILGLNHETVAQAGQRAKAKQTPESTLPVCCPMKKKKTRKQRRQNALEENKSKKKSS